MTDLSPKQEQDLDAVLSGMDKMFSPFFAAIDGYLPTLDGADEISKALDEMEDES